MIDLSTPATRLNDLTWVVIGLITIIGVPAYIMHNRDRRRREHKKVITVAKKSEDITR